MRFPWLSALFFVVAFLAHFATPVVPWDDMQVKHTWHVVPVNWESLGHPSAGSTIDLYIGLKPDQESALVDTLYEVSNPEHPRYGAYLSREQVAELVRPHPETLELVSAWLVHHGIRSSSVSTTDGGAWLKVTDVLVSQASHLLGASYQLYRNVKTNETIISTVGYALPAVLHAHIQFVAPTTDFSSTQVMQQTPRWRSFEAAPAQTQAASGKPVTARSIRSDIRPAFLRWLYDSSGYVPAATNRNKLVVVGDQYPSQEDLTRFAIDVDAFSAGATFSTVQLSGSGYDPTNPGREVNINLQYAGAMASTTPLVFYGTFGNLGFVRLLNYLNAQPKPPQTISITYNRGAETANSRDYATSMCNALARLGTRGASILIASGDSGIGAGTCQDASGNVRFIAEFPASCPYVTSVGGTVGLNPENAAIFSGGGFSTFFPRPPYQEGVMPKFLQGLGVRHAGRFNPHGRGYPDISAQSVNYAFVRNSFTSPLSGTNCALATVAGIVSLLNDFRISKGLDPLGFLNPWLYREDVIPTFFDVQIGFNRGCNTVGFPALEGWDPVTGLGTPDFRKLQKILPREVTDPIQDPNLQLPG